LCVCPYLSSINGNFWVPAQSVFLGENSPLGSFPFFRAQLLKHRHVILLCIILLCIHICSVNDENPHIKIEIKLWDATRSQQSHKELISQRLRPTSVVEWCTIGHLQKQKTAKNSTLCQWNPLRVTRSDLTDLWMATVLDWTGHRLLGPAGSTMATVHLR